MNNIEIYEKSLLSLMFENNKFLKEGLILINENNFLDAKNKLIFRGLKNLNEKNIEVDITTINFEIINIDSTHIVSQKYIVEIFKAPRNIKNFNTYVKEIVDSSKQRSIKRALKSVSAEVNSKNLKISDIEALVTNKILSQTTSTTNKDLIHMKELVSQAIQNLIEKRTQNDHLTGITTGFSNLNEVTGGFQKGDLVIIAARPSMGKTAFALNIAVNAAENNKVAIFSLEMGSIQLTNRFLSITGLISGNKLRDPKNISESDWHKINIGKNILSKKDIFINEEAGISINDLVWKSSRLKENNGLDLIIIDYLQLIQVSGNSENRQSQVSYISRTLKKLARDLNVPVIALSQLSRKVEQRESKIPMMSDLRESGAIEQDADIIAFLYRHSYYEEDKTQNSESNQPVRIIIGKHRNGSTGNYELMFEPRFGLFTEIDPKYKRNFEGKE
ncbi:MAG: replicative DNA helicase [Mollicutes bacterium PWAP]|nr:replicative DNA helicase [Mollicutes bacterium PWAP]